MILQNAKHLKRIMRDVALETACSTKRYRWYQWFWDPAFKFLNWGLADGGVCNTVKYAHTRTQKTHILHSTFPVTKYTHSLSRETKIPPIRHATEQLGWDLEQRHTLAHTSSDTSAETCVHRRNRSRFSFKTLRCGKETSGRAGKRAEKEANNSKTHLSVEIIQMFAPCTNSCVSLTKCSCSMSKTDFMRISENHTMSVMHMHYVQTSKFSHNHLKSLFGFSLCICFLWQIHIISYN